MDDARLIALDWGTSSLRAYLLGEGGTVLDHRAERWGIMQLPEGGFEAAFNEVTGAWLAERSALRVIAAGMVGSMQGWLEAPYCAAPAGADELARSMVEVAAGPLFIVPGVAQQGDPPNVMRGEETQIVGALALHPELAADSLLVLPGTHSKWVRVRAGLVRGFETYVTGELFAVLLAHSILGRPSRGASPPLQAAAADAFERGVIAARESERGVAPLLFSARALVLAGRLDAAASPDYLSGLLIGDEIRCGRAAGAAPSALLGDADLCARYVQAFELFGTTGVRVLEDTAPAGLWTIAEHARLTGPTRPEAVA